MPRNVEALRLSLGVLAHSRKENERRLPIHPAHFRKIAPQLLDRIFLEHGYGESFGVSDRELAGLVGGIRTRAQLIADCDVVLLPKLQASDLTDMRVGQIIWGWAHCVQDPALTQVAIDRRLTLVAFEAMNHWQADGGFGLHVFHKNNELAGYCSVLQALELAGSTGSYGRRLRAVVIGFGATARGAITALNAHGVDDVRVLTNREVAAVGSPIHSTQILQMGHTTAVPIKTWAETPEGPVPMAKVLSENDIIVNCVLQDPDAPLIFLTESDLSVFARGTLIVDVSCDEGMGFSWARPTSFTEPAFMVGAGVRYYAVDHSPSYLWDSATWEISDALLPHIEIVLSGPAAWGENPTIARSIEIRDGVIQNPGILTFQGRGESYPHAVHEASARVGA
jgi:alanine dehydrogenase